MTENKRHIDRWLLFLFFGLVSGTLVLALFLLGVWTNETSNNSTKYFQTALYSVPYLGAGFLAVGAYLDQK